MIIRQFSLTRLKQFVALSMAASLLLILSACSTPPGSADTSSAGDEKEKFEITFSLDWTPNTNHTGLFVAIEKGYFAEVGLEVNVVQPAENSAVTLAASGEADFAIDAQDTMAAALSLDKPLDVVAVAAILQHNTSGIISRRGESMDTPAGLEGKRYSTWNNPIELAMIDNLVSEAGGDFSSVQLIPNTITDEAAALMAKQTDAVWIFYGWSGINAELTGLDFDFFYLKDLNTVFDYYTPLVIANTRFLSEHNEHAENFMTALSRGYNYAIENYEEAAQILMDSDSTGSLRGAETLVLESQKWISEQYRADAEQWGYIEPARWNAFYSWLYEENLIENELAAGSGFTNEYLPNER